MAWIDVAVLVYNEARALEFAQAGNLIALYDLRQDGAGAILIGGTGEYFNGGANMSEPLREIEGTWEEVAARGTEFVGRRVRLLLLDDRQQDFILLPRPAPTAAQAALGIMPAAIGNGRGTDILRFVQTLKEATATRENTTTYDGKELWQAIAENRAERRKLAEEHE